MSQIVRYARTLGWLRWRIFLNAFKGTRRRDTIERLSRAGSAIAPIVLGLLFVPAFLMSCVISLIGGWAVGQRVQATPEILTAVRVALGAATAMILFIPAIRTARGPSTNLVRLALLPVPRNVLHVADMLAGLADPWIALLAPAMVLFPIGIVVAGRPVSGLIALLAGVALLATLLALASSVSSLLALLYRDRRRGEVVTLVVLLSLSFAGFVPMVLSRRMEDRVMKDQTTQSPGNAPREERANIPPAAPENEVHFPTALSWLPSELYARALFEPLRGRAAVGLLGLLGVAGLGSGFYALSWIAYKRLLDSPENISPRRGARAEPSLWRLPGLGPAGSAVALAQVRLVLRTVHGKMAVFFTPLSLLVMGFMVTRIGRHEVDFFGAAGAAKGPLLAYAGATFALLAPQRFMLNIFAIDGAGLTLAFLSPISERELVLGKSAGIAILCSIPMAIITTLVALFSPPAPIGLWVAVLVAAMSSYLILAPASAIIAAIFPKATDLNRLSGASNPNGIASLLGLLLTGLSCGPPALVALLTFLATGSAVLVLLAALGYAAVAAGISSLLMYTASRIVAARRENLALVAQGR